jgi:prepilin-type N-terminal cleavage/methylation domain-containing protein/prepilin-type processing-associated H-X9-DG protein
MLSSRRRETMRTLRRNGFTLIELLVVIAIIAILAAILFPVFARAREAARTTYCRSNLKQIGNAVMMYAQDYDETMPLWGQNPNPFNAGSYIYWLLDPYIKGLQATSAEKKNVWVCPSRRGTSGNNSYGYNYLRLGYVTTATTGYLGVYNRPAPLASLMAPADTVCFVDGTDVVRPPYGVQVNGNPDTVGGWHYGGPLQDNDGQTNVLWCDGHVKQMLRKKLVPPSRGGEARNDDLWDRVKPSPYTF